jgi:hypothetical protein
MFRIFHRTIFILTVLLTLCSVEAQNSTNMIDAAGKAKVIDEIANTLVKNYIFPNAAKKMADYIQQQLKKGAYDQHSDPVIFAEAVLKDLQSTHKDGHLSFHYDPEAVQQIQRIRSQKPGEVTQAKETQNLNLRKDNYGFRKAERLPGNVGLLKFDYFAFNDGAGEAATAALNFLANCDALIVDLRDNGGGDPAQIQYISSYFFDRPVHLNDIYSRKDDSTEHYWTLPYVPGKRLSKADIYVLTSSRTYSGAEEFSYNLKNLKRATIVGETTGGGAHPTEPNIISAQYVLYVPFARAINPITKTNWEGTGVTPDASVDRDKAFDEAYRMALETLASKAESRQKAELEWVLLGLEAKKSPPNLSEAMLQTYQGTYGERKVFLENGTLYYQRTGPRLKLVPLTETIFAPEGLEDFRLKFVIQEGKAVEVIGLYQNGHQDSSQRTQ